MPRTARASVGDVCYHVINRGNARARVFHKPEDYETFVRLIDEACKRHAMRVLAYCLMPNHFHLVLWPRRDGDLSRWMQWFLTAHVRRHHRDHGTSGHVWQGRFKAFPIQKDEHLLTVLAYVERNPLRAKLVRRAEAWRWSSLGATASTRGATASGASFLVPGPVARPRGWLDAVNAAEDDRRLNALRQSVNRGAPFGDAGWVRRTATRLKLESSLRPRGRPRKAPDQPIRRLEK